MASGLGFEGGNGDALAHEEIHKSGFSDIGISHDVYETGFVHRRKKSGSWRSGCDERNERNERAESDERAERAE